MSTPAERLAADVTRQFRRRMLEEYVPRIATCVEQLSTEQLWERPGAHGNSVANLLLHLEGNVRQWILAGLRGDTDDRNRSGEFAATAESNATGGAELMERLRATVTESVEFVDTLSPDALLAVSKFQGLWDETGLAAVLHVMEHFSGHAGQIYAHTKRVLGVDLRFYDI